MQLKAGQLVYRIIPMPPDRNFCKYGIHRYVVTKIHYGEIVAIDELDRERSYSISVFTQYGIFETEHIAKYGLKELLIRERDEALKQLEIAIDNYIKFERTYPEV